MAKNNAPEYTVQELEDISAVLKKWAISAKTGNKLPSEFTNSELKNNGFWAGVYFTADFMITGGLASIFFFTLGGFRTIDATKNALSNRVRKHMFSSNQVIACDLDTAVALARMEASLTDSFRKVSVPEHKQELQELQNEINSVMQDHAIIRKTYSISDEGSFNYGSENLEFIVNKEPIPNTKKWYKSTEMRPISVTEKFNTLVKRLDEKLKSEEAAAPKKDARNSKFGF